MAALRRLRLPSRLSALPFPGRRHRRRDGHLVDLQGERPTEQQQKGGVDHETSGIWWVYIMFWYVLDLYAMGIHIYIYIFYQSCICTHSFRWYFGNFKILLCSIMIRMMTCKGVHFFWTGETANQTVFLCWLWIEQKHIKKRDHISIVPPSSESSWSSSLDNLAVVKINHP